MRKVGQRRGVGAGLHVFQHVGVRNHVEDELDPAPVDQAFSVVPDVGLNVTRFSGASLRCGVVDTEFEGVPARITMPARTVVDCFRFRNKVGLMSRWRRWTTRSGGTR